MSAIERDFIGDVLGRRDDQYELRDVNVVIEFMYESVTHVGAAIWIAHELRRPLTAREFSRIKIWFPSSMPRYLLNRIAEKLRNPRSHLQLVK
jgi:hypothetical protein